MSSSPTGPIAFDSCRRRARQERQGASAVPSAGASGRDSPEQDGPPAAPRPRGGADEGRNLWAQFDYCLMLLPMYRTGGDP